MDRLSSLEHLRYRKALKEFATKYLSRKFTETHEEYAFVNDSLKQILETSLTPPWQADIAKMMKAELATADVSESYRDHFIHPFQDFLLGGLILDCYYEQFCSWYCDALRGDRERDLETCWLLATVFHDRLRPLEVLSSVVGDMYGTPVSKWDGMEPRFASYVASTYLHIYISSGEERSIVGSLREG